MPIETQLPDDDPLAIAWTAYKHSNEYIRSRTWASFEQHVDGSMWAAFEAGYRAGQQTSPDRTEKP